MFCYVLSIVSTSVMDNCRHVTALTVAESSSVLNPQKWACQMCGTTESVWVSVMSTSLCLEDVLK